MVMFFEPSAIDLMKHVLATLGTKCPRWGLFGAMQVEVPEASRLFATHPTA
jgi:hypothetical protein